MEKYIKWHHVSLLLSQTYTHAHHFNITNEKNIAVEFQIPLKSLKNLRLEAQRQTKEIKVSSRRQ